MHYSKEIISYLQLNNILASKLDHALIGVRYAVANQFDMIGAGAQRALYYTSCLTKEYQDVCQQQKNEDIRFIKSVNKILSHSDTIIEMLEIYFESIFRLRNNSRIDHIKKSLTAVNIHIAASNLTQHGFALAVTAFVAAGMKLSIDMSILMGNRAATAVAIPGMYGIVQKAADCANRLNYVLPEYYAALYANELEMMYFLIDPLFETSGALRSPHPSDDEISNIINNMIR
ncbi:MULTISPECIES: hypothetical protein [unclassified Pantoea]|uniref:hypothetical protein n=1 Tax=unclassified Pantoea TaxID=2630326 RepID=UPI00226A5A23|nr:MULTISPECIES: hypothetical protein [unclassified Pantoea]